MSIDLDLTASIVYGLRVIEVVYFKSGVSKSIIGTVITFDAAQQ